MLCIEAFTERLGSLVSKFTSYRSRVGFSLAKRTQTSFALAVTTSVIFSSRFLRFIIQRLSQGGTIWIKRQGGTKVGIETKAVYHTKIGIKKLPGTLSSIKASALTRNSVKAHITHTTVSKQHSTWVYLGTVCPLTSTLGVGYWDNDSAWNNKECWTN